MVNLDGCGNVYLPNGANMSKVKTTPRPEPLVVPALRQIFASRCRLPGAAEFLLAQLHGGPSVFGNSYNREPPVITSSASRLGTYLGLAKDAWQLKWSSSDKVREHARKHLLERLGRLRSLPQKLGQMIGFSHAQGEAADDFSKLEEGGEPLPLATIQPILESEWRRPLSQIVREISPQANAASLGQVHRATLHDGREVAIKVQYPGMREAILFDLKMLGWLSVPLGNLQRGFDLDGYRATILSDLERELDYRQEAAFQREFSAWGASSDFLIVPQVIDELSTAKVLVSRWEEGDHWREVQQSWSPAEQQSLGRKLVEFFHEGLFGRGILHADLHPGNVRFLRSGEQVRLLLYDFGCVYRPSETDRLALLRLIRTTCQHDESPYALFRLLGFREDFLRALDRKLPALCKVLFEPYSADCAYDIRDWRLGERVSDVLGEDRWNFRMAGPPELIFLMRAFHALIYYLEGLQACTSWSHVIRPLLKRYADDMQNLQLPKSEHVAQSFAGLAEWLRIRVTDDGATKVQITYRASAIDDLETLIDKDLQERLLKQGIQIKELVSSVRRRCYAPGDVFRLVEGSKEVAVWLE